MKSVLTSKINFINKCKNLFAQNNIHIEDFPIELKIIYLSSQHRIQNMKLKIGINDYTITVNKYLLHLKCKFVPDSNEVLLFFHGLACSWDSFKRILDKNYFSNKSLLFVDHVGFGESCKPEDFSYTMQDQAKIIDKLLTLLPNWNIHIVAHSMGVAIALNLKSETYHRQLALTLT